MPASAQHLAFHGTIVLLIGLVCGAPYGRAILGKAPAHIIHSWRVAHASLPIGAILMFSVATLLQSFSATPMVNWSIAALLIASSYAFCFALPLAALTGHRGLALHGPIQARLVYFGNATGALTSLLASILLVYAAAVSLFRN